MRVQPSYRCLGGQVELNSSKVADEKLYMVV